MKRLLSLLSLLAVALTATAQIEHSIVLDSNTFRVVQTDDLTGVSVDPIGMDSSRQPCARVKIFFHRMTSEQIAELEPNFPSGTIDCTKCKVADGNTVLVLEFTAKPRSKFYLKHPTFGTSNEVEFDFEGGKEYQLEATLNQTFSIVINSNEPNVDIYLDDLFKGQTDTSKSLTIKDVMIGGHKLKVVYGSVSYEQEIDVNSGSISFRQDVNKAVKEPQFVVFEVEPKSAVVIIDNHPYTLTDGAMQVVLAGGYYNYTVSAAGFHSYSGNFTVAGEKITKKITLVADVVNINISAPDGAEIWVNGNRKGVGQWSGTLTSGAYIFEAKKEGYKTSTLTKYITSDNPKQSYTLPAPQPIVGSLIISGTPIAADVTIDGKKVGQMPLKLDNIHIGQHDITISKAGYKSYTQSVNIAEAKTTTVNVTLNHQAVTATEKSSAPSVVPKSARQPKSNPIMVSSKSKKGYEQGVEATYSMHMLSGGVINHIGVSYIGGYRANKIFVGAGMGAEYNMDKVNNSSAIGTAIQNLIKDSSGYTAMSSGTISMPVFLHLRAYMGQKNRTFFSFSAGGKLFGSDTFEYEGESFKYSTNGLYADLNFGLKFGKFYCSLGAITQTHPCVIDIVNTNEIVLKSKFGIGAKLSIGLTF